MEEATIKLLNLLNKTKASGINLSKVQWLKKNKTELFSRKWEKSVILLIIFLLTFFYYSDYFFGENVRKLSLKSFSKKINLKILCFSV